MGRRFRAAEAILETIGSILLIFLIGLVFSVFFIGLLGIA